MDFSNLIGKTVKYFDYLGFERFGRIIFGESSNTLINYETGECDIYVYIEDEESEFNIHEIIINGEAKKYAEIRVSSEVYIDEKKGR